MLARQLECLSGTKMSGIVIVAQVPIILTGGSDKTLARLSSCAVALLVARHHTYGNAEIGVLTRSLHITCLP